MIEGIPKEAWVAATAVCTSLITLLGVWVTNVAGDRRLKIQLEQEQKSKNLDVRRERLEELYVESSRYMDAFVTMYLPYAQVMKGAISFNDALDMNINHEFHHNHERVNLIVDMYFPELEASLKKVKKAADSVEEKLRPYRDQYKSGDASGASHLPGYMEAINELVEAITLFKRDLSATAKEHITCS